MRTVWTVLVGLSAVVLGANPASAACGCCGCSRGVPVAAPGRVVFAPAPACCQLPVAAAPAPTQVAAADKKDEAKAADKDKEEAEIRAELAKLPPEDRKLAEQQKYCVIEDDNRLGEMGPPIKLMIKGQPVFICCKGCKKQAEADPDKSLAKVKELKAKAAAEAKEKK